MQSKMRRWKIENSYLYYPVQPGKMELEYTCVACQLSIEAATKFLASSIKIMPMDAIERERAVIQSLRMVEKFNAFRP